MAAATFSLDHIKIYSTTIENTAKSAIPLQLLLLNIRLAYKTIGRHLHCANSTEL